MRVRYKHTRVRGSRAEARSGSRRRRRQHAVALVALCAGLFGFSWQVGTPESQGMTSAELGALREFSDALALATGLIVMRNDVVVLEHYTGGKQPDDVFTVRSLTKSFGAGLLVRALDDGVVTLSEPGCSREDVSLHHLASMSSGMKKDSNETCEDPFYFEPGEDFAYSDGSANAVGDKLREFYGPDLLPRMAAILQPIGVEDWIWTDQRFSSGLRISVPGMIRYGRLWLRGGDWDGVQLLSAAGVSLATSPSNPQLKGDYGYLWWVNRPSAPYARYGYVLTPLFPPSAPADAFLGAGCESSYLLVVPSLQLVAGRAGGDCISIRDGTSGFTDLARGFVERVLAAVSACSDGLDNDGNGAIDHPADPGCSDLADGTEAPPVPALGMPGLAALALVLVGLGASWPAVQQSRARPRLPPRRDTRP
jgi:CubicO group peptidase (beta-lactamase class C family)